MAIDSSRSENSAMMADLQNQRLQRLGAVCYLFLGAAYVVFLVATVALAGSSSGGLEAQLVRSASHIWAPRLVAVVVFMGQAALVPAALVLYLRLAPGDRFRSGLAAISMMLAAIVGIASEIFELAVADIAVAYSSATADADKAGLLGAAKLADDVVTDGSLVWLLFFSIGLLLFGGAMLRARWPRWSAYFSLALGVVGVVGVVVGVAIPAVLGLAFVAFFVSILWNVATGITLWRTAAQLS
jgi:hypothetical protein